MKRILFLCISVLLFGVIPVIGQQIPDDVPKKAAKAFEKAYDLQKQGNIPDAFKEYDKALKRYPDFTLARIYKASLHYRLKEYELAAQNFKLVTEGEQSFPPKVYLTLGIIQYKLDQYDESIRSLKFFLQSGSKNQDLIDKARKHLTYAEFAAEAVRNQHDIGLKRLGEGINTQHSEYMPSVTADGKRMIYSRRVQGYELLFESVKVDGIWQEGKPIDRINEVFEGGAHSVSADGRYLVFTCCDRRHGFGSCDLFYSAYRRGQWTKPRNMGRPINSSAWDAQPALADNGKTLYFSSNRVGTIGGKDLWMSRRKPDGSWSKPINLGPDINTDKSEKTPFMHFDQKTLYFMSNGHPGMGDFDLFKTTKIGDTEWTEPINLGYPLNTKFQEGTLILDLSGEKGYFTSDRHHEKALRKEDFSAVETDIYQVTLPPELRPSPATYLEVWVLDEETRSPLAAEIKIHDNRSEQSRVHVRTQEDGYQLVCLPIGEDYGIQIYKPGYDFYSERMALEEVRLSTDPIKVEILLRKAENIVEEEPIVLKNILFETGSAVLKAEAKVELDFLVNWLNEHPDKSVEIRGHTDNVGDESSNLSLSQERAQAVVAVLTENGISSRRLSAIGYGESQPLTENDSPEGRAQNRRTEMVIKK